MKCLCTYEKYRRGKERKKSIDRLRYLQTQGKGGREGGEEREERKGEEKMN